MAKSEISNVSDTALWVAVYRAQETERPDALFRDPLASRLAGARGRKIAASMTGARYTHWSVVIRTYIIDKFIQDLVSEGVDTIINLGAGLDTRPYRLDLPSSLHWIEVDYPHMIKYKDEELASEKPKCKLDRFAVDLADDYARKNILAKFGSEANKALILTEGVIPYLSSEQVASLAEDLRRQPSFRFWILDYFAPQIFKYMRTRRLKKQMQNAPFQFAPQDWHGFFGQHGWKASTIKYLPEESEKLGRDMPIPWWAKVLQVFVRSKAHYKYSAYVLLEPK